MSEQLDLEAVRARAENAAPGPWVWRQCYEMEDGVHWAMESPESRANGRIAFLHSVLLANYPKSGCEPVGNDPNLVFIAHARTDIPALLAEVETLAGLVVDIVDLTPADERHRLPVPLRAYADRWREYVKSRPEWTANFGAEEWTEDDV